MNTCMLAHAGPAAEDAAREEWFAGVVERRKKRDEDSVAVEDRRKQVIDMTRKTGGERATRDGSEGQRAGG